jgi:hypothetical protein
MSSNTDDYVGVPTIELAELIQRRLPTYEGFSREMWAKSMELDPRQIRRIIRCESQWTGLNIADKIVMRGLDLNWHETDLTIIPKQSKAAAQKMADDEFRDGEGRPFGTQQQIRERATELAKLRDETLGDPTAEQRAFKIREAERVAQYERDREQQRVEQDLH